MKFNTPKEYGDKPKLRKLASRMDATINNEGELAFELDALSDLYIKAATCLVGEPKYYQTAEQSDTELIKAIHRAGMVDPEFILQLAVYCREKLYLRSVPLVLLAEFANEFAGEVPNARKYVSRCIQRADELTELVSYQIARNKVIPRNNGKLLPMMLKFGIQDAVLKFNSYHLGKYNRKDQEVKLVDVFNLVHPLSEPFDSNREHKKEKLVRLSKDHKNRKTKQIVNAIQATVTDENQGWRYYRPEWDALMTGTLESPETWEVMRSTGKMSWHDVIYKIFNKEGNVNNYMAILRNLRNMLTDSSVTKEDIVLLSEMLVDKHAVLNSKLFPFRFLSAYLVVKNTSSPYANMILDSLEQAISYSVENMPKLDGLTVIASDFSGSMNEKIGSKPTNKRMSYEQEEEQNKYSIYRCDIGQLLGMIANTFCQQTITGIFGDTWKVIPTSKYSGIIKNTVALRGKAGQLVGCSTNGYLVPHYLDRNDIDADRILLFTDCQMWNSHNDGRHFATEFLKYQKRCPNVKLYVFDLSGYSTLMLPQGTKNVCLVGGFSDRIFDFIPAFEATGKSNVIQTIKSIKI